MILHVDMDAFYASIEERDHPELVGKPLIVGGSPERRGVVSAANYVIRKFGVHSAMPTKTAFRLCPHAILLPVRMSHYVQVAEQIREILFRYTPLVEPLSLDEAFLDVTGSQKLFGTAPAIAARIKSEIRGETGLVASVGVAPSKFLAKIASDLRKPDALVVVTEEQVQPFLDPLPISRLWGAGDATVKEFEQAGILTIGDVRRQAEETLVNRFGRVGSHFWELAHGRDPRPVVPDREAKSISHEMTFAADIQEVSLLVNSLRELTEQVARRLRRHERVGKTVQLKLRYADFHTITRAQTLPGPTSGTEDLWDAVLKLFQENLPQKNDRIRLLGVGVSRLECSSRPRQLQLFDNPERQKRGRLDSVADQVREKFGAGTLMRGSGLRTPSDEPSSISQENPSRNWEH